MKICALKRMTGKTTALVKLSAKNQSIIVVATRQQIDYVMDLAKGLNVNIPKPILFSEMIRRQQNPYTRNKEKYLIDELQMILDYLNVDAVTVDSDYLTTSLPSCI